MFFCTKKQAATFASKSEFSGSQVPGVTILVTLLSTSVFQKYPQPLNRGLKPFATARIHQNVWIEDTPIRHYWQALQRVRFGC